MEGDSLAASRSRRQKSDKHGRLAALAKISQLKGGKHKYDIREEAPVYDYVTEEEYAKNVQSRQEDDWIVDDGTGYAEDGREIFDDDEDEAPAPSTTASKTKKSFAPPTKRPDQKKSNDIKSMFMAIPAKKKPEKEIKVDDDELLRDIMKSVSSKISPANSAPKPTLLKKRSAPIQESPKTFRQPSNPFGRKRLPRVLEESSDNFSSAPSVSPYTALREPSDRQSKRKLDDEEDNSFTSNKTVKIEDGVPAIEGFDSQECRSTDVKIEDSEEMDADCSALLDDIDGDQLETEDNVQPKEPIAKMERNYLEEKPEANLKESTFEAVWESPSSSPVVCDVHVDSSHLPMTTNDKGEEVLRMYWLDAYEDYFKHPGVVYLFGKVFIETGKTWVSCCIVVKNISRKVLLLKREKKLGKNGMPTDEPCDMNDVYLEFREAVMDKYKISEFKCKPSTKLYSFEKEGVPYRGDYLEVIYSADCPQLPMDLKGKTFSHIFGTNTSSLEQLLIDRKMKGPSWLEVKNPSLSNPPISWCKLEAVITNPSQISVLTSDNIPSPPPLVIMALTLKSCLNQSTNQNEIVAVACLAHLSFPLDRAAPKQPFQSHFCAITKPSNMIFPYGIKEATEKYKNSKVERMESERAMLNFVLGKIHKTDPDLIVGHDIVGFDIKLLLHRLNDLKISQWSRLGRLRRTIMPKITSIGKGFHAERNATCGRLVCDIQVSAKELIRSKSYDLSELVGQVLHQKHCSVPQEHVRSKYEKATELIKLVDSALLDGSLILKLMCELNVLPLALQITNIAGNLLSRTLLGGRSERNEYLLLHAFHEKNFICPDKNFDKSKKETDERDDDEEIEVGSRKKGGRKKPSYAGGLVLDPKKGFYDKYILLMDFNSLYPSIIQEYNICFTTVAKPEHKPEKEEEMLVELPESSVPPGVLPTEIRKLVESRRQVKQMMKAPNLTADLKMQYDIRQKALKLTANSMYGCLGFSNSRFYAKQLAALVTGKGREVLLHTKELVQKMGLEVIYGDTDSIMINSNCLDYEEVMKLGIKVKNEVNKLYRQLELDVDGLYKPMLLLKKKKYAALSISKASGSGELIKFQEMKGLDTVRRDWSDLAKNAGTYVIGQILSDNLRDEVIDSIHTYLQELGKNVKSGQTPLSSFIINKQLTKNPEDYPDKKNLAHVQVAMRMNSKSGKKLKQGDTVFYVICQDGTSNSAIQRSYHPDELTSSETLQIDTNYYLSQQVLPVVSRLCEPIDGMDTPTLAEFLGLDPTSYKQQTRYQNRDEDDTLLGSKSIFNDENRFVDCDPLRIVCPNSECCEAIEAKEPFKGTGIELECSLSQCPSCKLELSQYIPNICNQLTRCIRQYINQYYLSWFSCEDPSCSFRTRKLGLRITRSGPICPSCEKSTLRLEYTESQLYLQLACFQKVLDISDKVISKLSHEKEKTRARNHRTENEKLYRHLKAVVDNYQKRNAYGEVVLSKLFQGLFKPDLGTN